MFHLLHEAMMTINQPKKLSTFLSVILLSAVTTVWAQDVANPAGPTELPAHKLVGVVEGSPENARAIFEDTHTNEQKLYRLGDVIDGAILIEIKRRQILLQRGPEIVGIRVTGGRPDERKMVEREPEQKKLSGAIPVPAGISDPRQAIQKVFSQQVSMFDSQVVKKPVPGSTMGQFVEGFQKQMGQPTLFVNTPLGPALSMEHVDPAVLSDLGLKPTDMVVGISGMSLEATTPARIGEIFEMLGHAKFSNISVLRDQSVERLAYEVQQ